MSRSKIICVVAWPQIRVIHPRYRLKALRSLIASLHYDVQLTEMARCVNGNDMALHIEHISASVEQFRALSVRSTRL